MMTEVEVLIPDNNDTDNAEDDNNILGNDKYNLAYLSFFLIGIGMLLPWNFFINADQYFKSKLSGNQSDLKMFESAFSICSQIPCGLGLILNLFLTNRVSRNGRVVTALVISTICFILTTILVNVDTTSWTSKFFYVTLITIAIINFCSGIYQGTIFGITGVIGARYIQASITGMSVAGAFASISDIISMVIGNNNEIDATVYFSIASFVLVACLVTYIFVTKLKLVKMKLQKPIQLSVRQDEERRPKPSVTSVIRQIYPLALSVTCIYTVTIALMPAILSDICSVNADDNSEWTNKYFAATTAFLVFNIGDFAGRILSGIVRVVQNKGLMLPFLCISRVVFIPLFLLCNYQPRHRLPVIFQHDTFPIFFNVVFSFTNGYLTSLCMMYGPQLVQRDLMETAGATMQLFLTIGTGLGALLSILLVNVV